MGSREVQYRQDVSKEVELDPREVNYHPRLDVSFSYSENPYEYSAKGARRARVQLGLTHHPHPTARSQPGKEHAMRESSWG
jgi:hypothetical protein